MAQSRLKWVFLGLTLSSSWGNGHATTYRGLLRALAARGHSILFLERDVPWYAAHRDSVVIPGVKLALYSTLSDLEARFRASIAEADVVVVGSFVPEGREVGARVSNWARGTRAFYDLDTPVTVEALEQHDSCEYLARAQLRDYHLYLTFTGGPIVDRLEQLGASSARPLYCAVDPVVHHPVSVDLRWDLGYLGTYSPDRQPPLEELLLTPARGRPTRAFVVAGPLYPPTVDWPANVQRLEHVAPLEHSRFYCQQRLTLNLTRADMRDYGYAPSVRLFEAAACGATIVTDVWDGLDLFFEPRREVLLAATAADVEHALDALSEADRHAIGAGARARVLAFHTAAHRAATLERYVAQVRRRAFPSAELRREVVS